MHLNKIIIFFLMLSFFIFEVFADDKLKATFFAGESAFGKKGYRYSLLEKALSYSGKEYELSYKESGVVQERRRLMLSQKDAPPYVMVMGSNPEFEKEHRAIYFPIYLGIGSGYRLLFTRKGLTDKLSGVSTIKDLQEFSMGQGTDWSDVPILENAGLKVIQVSKKQSLWKMTELGRIDLFPRGIFEIFGEYAHYKKKLPDLVINDRLLVTYPFAIYYFVDKKNEKLALAIESGLVKAYESGDLQKLLLKSLGPNIKNEMLNLHKRVRIDLPAYNISKKTLGVIKQFPFKLEDRRVKIKAKEVLKNGTVVDCVISLMANDAGEYLSVIRGDTFCRFKLDKSFVKVLEEYEEQLKVYKKSGTDTTKPLSTMAIKAPLLAYLESKKAHTMNPSKLSFAFISHSGQFKDGPVLIVKIEKMISKTNTLVIQEARSVYLNKKQIKRIEAVINSNRVAEKK